MFDYNAFEQDVIQQMTIVFQRWTAEHDDIYIFSLDCTRQMDSIGVIANTTHYLEEQTQEDLDTYWYNKYCEEAWELFDTFQTISENMQTYTNEKEDMFINPKTYTYTEAFDEHCDEIIKRCQKALIQFREKINPKYANILLTLQVGEYLDSDEKAEIFQAVNTETASQEYVAHIPEFV